MRDGSKESGRIWIGNGGAVSFVVAEKSKVAPGVWASPGTRVAFTKAGRLFTDENLAGRAEISRGLIARNCLLFCPRWNSPTLKIFPKKL